MRVYGDCYELMSEIYRDVWEMGHIVHPRSMQNKIVEGDEGYMTKEVINYAYSLTNLFKVDYLFLADPKARIWAEAEFDERVSKSYRNPGQAWKLRRDVWTEFLKEWGFEYTYNERMAISLDKVISELKINPDTRQAIISVWDPDKDIDGIGGNYRVPCSVYYQAMVRDNRLHLVYNQRSADVVTHFGNDVYLAWKLMEYIADSIRVKRGYLFHNIGSLHAYKKDWDILKLCIEQIKS